MLLHFRLRVGERPFGKIEVLLIERLRRVVLFAALSQELSRLAVQDEPVEAIRDVRDVVFSVYPKDKVVVGTARPASVASIIQIRPYVSVVSPLPHVDFDRMLSMALAGQVKYAFMFFTTPRYGRALVTNLSFSNEREED